MEIHIFIYNIYVPIPGPTECMVSASCPGRISGKFDIPTVIRINTEAGFPVSYEVFYVHKLHDYCDLRLSYFNWKVAK